MATAIKLESHFAADVSTAFSRLTSLDVLAQVMTETESLDPQVEVEVRDDGARVLIRRSFEADWPALVASFIGPRLTIVETRTWLQAANGDYRGELALEVPGLPIAMTADMTLTADASGCQLTIDGKVNCSVPFIGGSVEALAAEQITSAIETEVEIVSR